MKKVLTSKDRPCTTVTFCSLEKLYLASYLSLLKLLVCAVKCKSLSNKKSNQTRASRSSEFVNHSYDYRLNWTPLSPIPLLITLNWIRNAIACVLPA